MRDQSPLTFKEWTSWLETRHVMPLIAPGLERTLQALEMSHLFRKNDPAHTIHVAGTNGKGTTAKTLAHLIHCAGESVGLFTSPHLVSTCERISVNGINIPEEDFVALCKKHYVTITACNLTHFEALTILALDYFLNVRKTKWMIFEIGLGGLWDSTNTIPHNTSIITTLGMDHMHILGNTIEEIAKNKFGIIQENNLVIHQKYTPEIEDILASKLEETKSQGLLPFPLEFQIEKALIPRYVLLQGEEKIPLSLPGKRAIDNISTAVTAFKSLGLSLDSLSPLKDLSWPARLTPLNVPESPCPVYLSGDHNEQGLESLCEILENSDYKNLNIVLGLSKNRSHKNFVDRLQRLRNTKIIFTAPSFQGVTPDNPAHVPYYKDPRMALSEAMKNTKAHDLVVITGSLYLCGDYLALFPTP